MDVNELLKEARRDSRMVTEYRIKDGPIVPALVSGNIRIEVVIIKSWDNGYTEIDVEGRSVTKSGAWKSGYRQSANMDTIKAVKAALAELGR